MWASVEAAPGLGSCSSVGLRLGSCGTKLWGTSLVAPCHMASSQTRTQTCVPSIGRQVLIHCVARRGQSPLES